MRKKICCIFNLAPHYNGPIYKLMDEVLSCHFYIGDRVPYQIKLMDYPSLSGFKKALKNIPITGNFYWQKGALKLSCKPYGHYIITGEPFCLSTWLILIICRLLGKKTYLWTHGWYGDEGGVKKIVKKMFFGLANVILLYGDYARNLMIAEGFNPDKLTTIYNSLDYSTQLKIRSSLVKTSIYKNHFQNEFPVLLYVGRIQIIKKLNLLIEAMNVLKKNGSFYNLILIGDQVEGTKLEDLISAYDLQERVWFYGHCYDEKVLGEFIYNADLCVSPGNVGLTVMHSFAYGTPVVTHDDFPRHGTEFEAIQPDLTGSFFKENSLDDLCLKITEWTNVEEKKREHIRQNCYKVIDEKYNPYNQIKILKTLLIK